MSQKFSLLYYQKKPKNYVNGPIHIYGRITVEGQRSEFSTGHSCDPGRWNSKGGKPLGNNEEAKSLITYLDTIKAKLYESLNRLNNDNKPVTAQILKDHYFGKSDKPRSLMQVFQNHNQQMEKLVGKEYAKGTLKRYETSLRHTQEFLEWKHKATDYDIRFIDHAFVMDYDFFLRSVRNCANNSAVKYMRNFQKIINTCLSNEWIEKDPFAKYNGKVIEIDRGFLTQPELDKITNKVFYSKRLEQVRDVFIFSCYTGLAYIDAKKLNKSNIVIGLDGGKWIHIHRQKTDTAARIPILPIAQAILDKYAENPACIKKGQLLPVLSNQKMNDYIKEICVQADVRPGDLDQPTCHWARHTFATTVTLSNGVPIESVSKMLGHKDIKITQHYAKILDSKVSADMSLLRQRMQAKKEPELLKVAN